MEEEIDFYSFEDFVIEKFQSDFSKVPEDSYMVYAKENGTSNRWVYASQYIDGEDIKVKKEIKVTEPKYYYIINCNNCSDDPSQKQECEQKLKQCKKSIKDNDNIFFVLDENDEIIECNKELNDKRRSYVKSSTSGNHGFNSRVKEAPCAFKCPGPDDKQTSSSQLGIDVFEETGCPKRASRFIQFSQSKENYYGTELQHLLDSLGANGWSVCKDVNLLPIYLVVTHDTLSKPARNEKFSYKIFRNAVRTNDFWTIVSDSANIYGKQGYELMVINAVSTIMMKDITKPSLPVAHYEYMLKTQVENAFTSESDYEMNGDAVNKMLNQLGDQGWDLCVIGEHDCVMQRVKEKANFKYEYNLVNMDGVSGVKPLFNSRGAEGWDYCLWPLVAHRSSFTPPMVMKRIKGQPKQFEYNFKFVSQINLFSSKSSFERSLNDMQNAFQGTMSNGWKYSGVLTIDESFKEFHDKIFFVFQVDKGCK